MSTFDLLDRSTSTNPDDWPIFSYSQLQAWDRCEKLWYYAYPLNWQKVRQQEYLNLGTEIHLSFKNWYDLAIAKIPKDVRKEKMFEYFAKRINEADDGVDYEMMPTLNRALWLSMRYFNEFAPIENKGHKIIATEYHFTVHFVTGKGRHFILQGYIDLLTKFHEKLWAWDHKTMYSNFWSPVQVMMEPQTPLYSAALREQGEDVHGVIINMVNTYEYKRDPESVPVEKLFARETAYRSSAELDTFVREMKYIVDDILENFESPRRSLRLDCKNCSFQEPCLMEMKGINSVPLLQSEYRQKTKIDVDLKFDPERLIQSA